MSILKSPLVTIAGSVLATFIIATAFFKLGGPIPISVTQTSVEKVSTFDITGEGSAQVVPDEARATFGITSSAPTVTAAQEKANTIINNIKATLKNLNVAEKDIKTTAYSVRPDYSYAEGRTHIVGYNVNAQLEVAFKNFETLNSAIDAATQNGANIVNQLSFELSEETREKAEDQARKEAIDKAKEKAKKIAGDAGITLGKIINVQENSSVPPIFRGLSMPMGTTGVQEQTEISPGVSEVKIQVTLSFETR